MRLFVSYLAALTNRHANIAKKSASATPCDPKSRRSPEISGSPDNSGAGGSTPGGGNGEEENPLG